MNNNIDILFTISIIIFMLFGSISMVLNYIQILNQEYIIDSLEEILNNWKHKSAVQLYLNSNGVTTNGIE